MIVKVRKCRKFKIKSQEEPAKKDNRDSFPAPACMQNGRKIVVDVDLAIELFNTYQNGNN